METDITYQKEALGRAEVTDDGLFWKVFCQILKSGARVLRLYGVEGFASEYLGIPGADGLLHCRIPKSHMPEGISFVIASEEARGQWLPWKGLVEGVSVESGLLRPDGDALLLALPPEEMVKFPEWVEIMENKEINQREFAVLTLNTDGKPPLIERESRGTTDEEMDFGNSGIDLPDGAVSLDGFGPGGGEGADAPEEAGSADL